MSCLQCFLPLLVADLVPGPAPAGGPHQGHSPRPSPGLLQVAAQHAPLGRSVDNELTASLAPSGDPNLEHLSILLRWQGSRWRDGEWIGFESLDKIPYRRLVNAIGRVASAARVTSR